MIDKKYACIDCKYFRSYIAYGQVNKCNKGHLKHIYDKKKLCRFYKKESKFLNCILTALGEREEQWG